MKNERPALSLICTPAAPAPRGLGGRGEPYLDAILEPSTRSQVPAEGAGEHSVLPQPCFRVSQALEEVAWRDRERLGTPRNPPGPASQAMACAAPWEASACPQSRPHWRGPG